ncbi:hypothetical protein AB3N02_21780 [Priestia aryabhattai]
MKRTNDMKEIEEYLNNNIDKIEKFELGEDKIVIHTKDSIITITED